MIKLSDRWNNNWPDCFKGNYYNQPKGQIIEDLRILERTIESRDDEIHQLKESNKKIQSLEAEISKSSDSKIEEKKFYHKCDFWCVKCGLEIIPNQTGILNHNEDCHYCLQCKESKMKEIIFNNEKDQLIKNLKEKLAEFEARERANESLNRSLREIKINQHLEAELESMTSYSYSNFSLIEDQNHA